jgi:dTDP-4-dehydrorhamnose 3,5-epimerase-like enzyme
MIRNSYCHGKVYRIVTTIFEDTRGALAAVDFTSCDFHPVRAFVVTAPPGAVRGGHGHTKGRQLLMRLSGEIDVEVCYRGRRQQLKLDATDGAMMIDSPVWSRQTYLGVNPSMIVFCDAPYDPDGYIWTMD